MSRRTPRACSRLGDLEQRWLLHQIDLVDDQDLGAPEIGKLVKHGAGSRVDAAFGIEDEPDQIRHRARPPKRSSTMARSSRRFGAKMPGVSINISCERPAVAMPRSNARVVCTLCETMATLLRRGR